MARKKISELDDGGIFQAGDSILIARGGANYQLNGAQIADTVANVANTASAITDVSANVATLASTVSGATTRITTLEGQIANAGAGTVTSVAVSGTGITVTGSPITTSGTIGLALTGTGVTAGIYSLATVSVGTDGRVTAISNGTASSGGASAAVSSGSTAHRYWRFVCLDSTNSVNGQRYFAIAEVEMRTLPGGNDLCTGGTAIARSAFSSNPAANAFDDNLATQYETGGDTAHQASTTANVGNWIGYDFGTPTAINVLTLKNNTNLVNERIVSGVFQYSDDGVLYQNAWSVQGVNTANNSITTSINPNYDNGTIGARSYTLAQANALVNLRNGDGVFVNNGRKVGEAAGAGTGVPGYYSGGSWRNYRDDTAITT